MTGDSSETRLGPEGYLALFIIMLLSIVLSIFLDIPILRQLGGFLLLSIVPGLLILYILRLDRLGLVESIALSIGLSISFVMFFGLLINWIYPAFGYATPLSTKSVLISFALAILGLGIVAYKRNRGAFSSRFSDLRLNASEKAILLLPAFFPLISILGMRFMNTTDNNAMLMVLLFLVPAYLVFIALMRHQTPERIYPTVIFLVGISLLLLFALRSNHLVGVDVHLEFSILQLTTNEQHWRMFGAAIAKGTYNACLSVTLLPAIYQSILNINSEYLFKILYPLLFSVSPLVVYIISKKYIGSFYAFLASFFFMSQTTFLSISDHARTNMAILFFALAIMVLFHNSISEFAKRALFIVFAVSCIVSHYSTSYLFLFIMLLTWIGMQAITKLILSKRKTVAPRGPTAGGDPPQSRLKSGITLAVMALFFVMLFFWYSQVTQAPFSSGVRFFQDTLASLYQMFLLEARAPGVQSALGGVLSRGIPYAIEFVFSWLTIAFIAIGVLSTLARRRRMIAFTNEERRPKFLTQKFNAEFFILSLSCCVILVISLTLPSAFIGYAMDRTYFQTMVVLSPFFVIGGITLAKFLRAKPYWIILIVLIPYFMCTTGTMYQMFDVPRAMVLNSEGFEYECNYVHEEEVYAARWLGIHAETKYTRIYTDYRGKWRLVSQGGLSHSLIDCISLPDPERKERINGYIYLRYHNVINGKLLDKQSYQQHLLGRDIAEYQGQFVGMNKIYSNGGSEIWR